MWEDILCRVPVGSSKFRLCAGYKCEPDSEVGLVTRLHDGRPRNRGSITGRRNNFVPTPKRLPDRLLEPTPFVINGRSRVFSRRGWVVGAESWWITPCDLWIKNKLSYISTPPKLLHDMHRNSYFLPCCKCLSIHKDYPNLDRGKLSCFQVLGLIRRPNKYSTWLGTVYLFHKNWSSGNSRGFSISISRPPCVSFLPACLNWAECEVILGIKEYKWQCPWTEKQSSAMLNLFLLQKITHSASEKY